MLLSHVMLCKLIKVFTHRLCPVVSEETLGEDIDCIRCLDDALFCTLLKIWSYVGTLKLFISLFCTVVVIFFFLLHLICFMCSDSFFAVTASDFPSCFPK